MASQRKNNWRLEWAKCNVPEALNYRVYQRPDWKGPIKSVPQSLDDGVDFTLGRTAEA